MLFELFALNGIRGHSSAYSNDRKPGASGVDFGALYYKPGLFGSLLFLFLARNSTSRDDQSEARFASYTKRSSNELVTTFQLSELIITHQPLG